MSESFSTLRLFTRFARKRNFTAAGQEIGLSQPSVSRIISRLEKDLGVSLFTRTTHAVTLTEAGEEYLARIEPILSDMEEANHAVRGSGELRGTLRIGAATSFAQRGIIPILPSFMAEHPKLKIDLVLTDNRQDLVRQAIDIAIRFGKLEDSNMIAKKLGVTPRLIAASPTYLKQHGIPKTPADLANHHLILGPSSSTWQAWSFKQSGKIQSERLKGRLTVTVNEGTTVAAVAGLGIISTALWGCKPEIESGQLVRVLSNWDLGQVEIHALLAGGRGSKPSARAFTTYLQDNLNQN